MSTTFVLADHPSLYRNGMAAALETEPGFRILAMADSVEDALKAVEAHRPDICIISSVFFSDDTRTWEQLMLQPSAVVLLLDKPDKALLQQAMSKGVLGFIQKDIHPSELTGLMKQVRNGMFGICKNTTGETRRLLSGETTPVLLEEEVNLLRLLCQGASASQIGSVLHKSKHTIDKKRKKLFDKLGVRNLAGLVRYALENGLVK